MEIFLLALVVMVVSAARRFQRRRRLGGDLDHWAQVLGMVRVGDELFGADDEIPLGARLAFDSPNKNAERAHWTLYARLQPPLDLGLVISNKLMPVALPGTGAAHANFGHADPSFDQRCVVACDEPARAQALLTGSLRRVILDNLHPQAMFMITDAGVAVQTVDGHAGESELRNGLRVVTAIAHSLNAAREHVPPAMPLIAHRDAWVRFAGGNGLQGISAPLCMFGTIDDATMYAYSVRTSATELQLEVWLRFEQPLALGLLVQPMRTVDRFKELFGAEDYKLGDALFDETFLVRVSDGPATAALLDAETRKRLLLIHDTVGPLSLTDDGLSVRLPYVPPDPAIVPTIARQMLEIARFIADKRRGQQAGGPYR